MNADPIVYRSDRKLSVEEFADVLCRTSLGVRRPIDDPRKLQLMLDHGNVLITAWHEDRLVGVSRALTDFSFCCYLSDLAVDESYQRQGIGKHLIAETHRVAGTDTTLILLAAPAAREYYPRIGMERFSDCFRIARKSS
ncbi:MAG TPA: GNAT family N-acetyltransferase [Chryseolinea sp.]|nr:GNAT family N-acetyltransferase [Chryseolinea sp.]